MPTAQAERCDVQGGAVPAVSGAEGSTKVRAAGALRRATRQTAVYMSFQGLGMLVSLVSFPVMTRLLSVGDYGDLALVNATLVILLAVAKCGSPTALIRYLPKHGGSEVRLISSAVGVNVLAAAAVILCYLLGTIIVKSRGGTGLPVVMMFVAPLLLVRVLTALFLGFMRAEERVVQLSVLTLAMRLSGFAAGVLCAVAWIKGLVGFFAGGMVMELASLAAMMAWLRRRQLLKLSAVSGELMKVVFLYGSPLILFEVSSLINDYADRFLIRTMLGAEHLGVYSAGYNLVLCVQGLVTAPIWMACFPVVNKLWAEGNREGSERFMADLLKYYLSAAILIVGGVTLFGNELVVLLAGAQYAQASTLMPLLILGAMVSGSYHITAAGLFLENRTKRVAAVTLTAAACNVALNLALLPRFGLMGAAWATLISYSLMAVLMTVSARSTIRVPWPTWQIPMYLGVATCCVLIVGLFPPGGVEHLLFRGGLLVSLYGAAVLTVDARLRGWVRNFLLRKQ